MLVTTFYGGRSLPELDSIAPPPRLPPHPSNYLDSRGPPPSTEANATTPFYGHTAFPHAPI